MRAVGPVFLFPAANIPVAELVSVITSCSVTISFRSVAIITGGVRTQEAASKKV